MLYFRATEAGRRSTLEVSPKGKRLGLGTSSRISW